MEEDAMPRRSRKPSKRRAFSRISLSLARLIKRLWKQDWIRLGIFAFLLLVLTVNLSVRILGRSAGFPLSPYHLLDKSRALAALARHWVMGKPQPTQREIRLLLHHLAAHHKIPSSLVFAVAGVESDFMPVRISPAGAMGLMQLMPETASDLYVGDPYDARQNASGGVRYLAELYRRYRGDIRRVAAAYNAGHGNVPVSGVFRMRRETSAYVARVQYRMGSYQSLDAWP
jgi:soluble lytic murein transglycosylase-like protein